MCARLPSGLRTFLELRYSEPGDAEEGEILALGYYAPAQRLISLGDLRTRTSENSVKAKFAQRVAPGSGETCTPTLGEKRSGRAGGGGVRARPGNGFDCTRESPAGAVMGIMFSYVQISRLVLVAYIRNTLRHRGRAKRRAGVR